MKEEGPAPSSCREIHFVWCVRTRCTALCMGGWCGAMNPFCEVFEVPSTVHTPVDPSLYGQPVMVRRTHSHEYATYWIRAHGLNRGSRLYYNAFLGDVLRCYMTVPWGGELAHISQRAVSGARVPTYIQNSIYFKHFGNVRHKRLVPIVTSERSICATLSADTS